MSEYTRKTLKEEYNRLLDENKLLEAKNETLEIENLRLLDTNIMLEYDLAQLINERHVTNDLVKNLMEINYGKENTGFDRELIIIDSTDESTDESSEELNHEIEHMDLKQYKHFIVEKINEYYREESNQSLKNKRKETDQMNKKRSYKRGGGTYTKEQRELIKKVYASTDKKHILWLLEENSDVPAFYYE